METTQRVAVAVSELEQPISIEVYPGDSGLLIFCRAVDDDTYPGASFTDRLELSITEHAMAHARWLGYTPMPEPNTFIAGIPHIDLVKQSKNGCKTTVSTTDLLHYLIEMKALLDDVQVHRQVSRGKSAALRTATNELARNIQHELGNLPKGN